MMLAEAVQVDLVTLIAAVVAFLGGGVGSAALKRRGHAVESAPEFEARVRREAELDANVAATSAQVATLAKLVDEMQTRAHEHANALQHLGFRVRLLDGEQSGPIHTSAPT